MRLPCLLLAAALATMLSPEARADSIQTFALDGSDEQCLSDDQLVVTLEDLSVGDVTFDAILIVVGSSDLNQLSSGLGVNGGSNPINDGEYLTFSMDVENEAGGSVLFEGFTGVDLTFFGGTGEQAIFSEDDSLVSTSDNFLIAEGSAADPADISGTSPLSFAIFGNDAGGTVSFRVDSIDADFSEVQPVPEPSTLALLSVGLGAVAVRRRRTRRAGRGLG